MRALIAALVAGALVHPVAAAAAEKADRILVNGRIWTADPARPWAEALAERGQTLIAVGTNSDIRSRVGTGTVTVDLKGRLVVPGFIDTDVRLMKGGLQLATCDASAASTAELQARLKDCASRRAQDLWLRAHVAHLPILPPDATPRRVLDEAVPARAVVIEAMDGDSLWANSLALAAGAVVRGVADPLGGRILRDGSSEPTGCLRGTAMAFVTRLLPETSAVEAQRALEEEARRAAAVGVTSVIESLDDPEALGVYENAQSDGRLKLRLALTLPLGSVPASDLVGPYQELRARATAAGLPLALVRGAVDGPIASRMASFGEPYADADAPAPPPLRSGDALAASVEVFERANFGVALQASGETAVAMALDAFAEASRRHGRAGGIRLIQRLEAPRPEDLRRLLAAGIAVTSDPGMPAAADVGARLTPLVGAERAGWAFPLRALRGGRGPFALASGWPAEAIDPLRRIQAAALGLGSDRRLTSEEALRSLTVDAARLLGEQAWRGSLTRGRLADYVVLSDDILASPAALARAKVLLTVKGGQDTYRGEGF